MKNIDKLNLVSDVLSLENIYLVSNFSSGQGNLAFDNYLKYEALGESKSGNGVTYLIGNILNNEDIELVAYYTISANSIPYEDIIDDEDEIDIKICGTSAIEIKMFAVNGKYQDCLYKNKLVSQYILEYIIDDISRMATGIIGAKNILLASVESAVRFYENSEFSKLESYMKPLYDVMTYDCVNMYLRIHE